jgi:Zn-dependent protease
MLQLNLYLMAFNLLLPAYPLDGGRIFADALLLCRVPVRVAAYITAALAVAIAAGLIAWGIIRLSFITALVRRLPSKPCMQGFWPWSWSQQVIWPQVGGWMLYATLGLCTAVYQGTEAQHPLFCYEDLPAPQQAQSSNPEVMLPAHQPRSAAV